MDKQLKACVAEAIGTFVLCFLGAGSICLVAHMGSSGPGLLGVAVAHGIALSVAVSATMNVSGGHVNPAVTIGMLVTGRIRLGAAVAYILAQLAGAVIAGVAVLLIFDSFKTGDDKSVVRQVLLGTPAYNALHTSAMLATGIEAVLTFLLLFAVFGTAVDPRAPKIGGFGIGLTIAADILVGGPLTGAAMNPARTFGPGLVAALSGNMPEFWPQQAVYWIGPVLGGVAASLVYQHLILDKGTK
ncbi:MAG: aquaporin [Planctomycetes bacterium]|nr:aquaporin [Planctomycetota bacterium]